MSACVNVNVAECGLNEPCYKRVKLTRVATYTTLEIWARPHLTLVPISPFTAPAPYIDTTVQPSDIKLPFIQTLSSTPFHIFFFFFSTSKRVRKIEKEACHFYCIVSTGDRKEKLSSPLTYYSPLPLIQPAPPSSHDLLVIRPTLLLDTRSSTYFNPPFPAAPLDFQSPEL